MVDATVGGALVEDGNMGNLENCYLWLLLRALEMAVFGGGAAVWLINCFIQPLCYWLRFQGEWCVLVSVLQVAVC